MSLGWAGTVTCSGSVGPSSESHGGAAIPQTPDVVLPPATPPDEVEDEPPAKRLRVGADSIENSNLDVLLINWESGDLEQKGVAELYSVPQVNDWAARYGLDKGWSLDAETVDPEGVKWDFDQRSVRDRARELLQKTRPRLLVGSPMCRYFSQLVQGNGDKMEAAKATALWNNALVHLEFAVELYKLQVAEGRLFLHEHFDQACSCDTGTMQDILNHPEVVRVVGDMCSFGLTSCVDGVELPALTPTGYATNCPELAAELSQRCHGGHPHGPALNE